ncbi:MAG: LON peptidase substrate-binding domain-containing protein [Opitutaceae bacterium]|nr:LON peptidase substrate-binding domain-containing protein [Opitutaceae bacterium]
MEITLPDLVPVMTLPNVTFFPQALLPLHIFEPRYRAMLSDTLDANRLFAVAGLDEAQQRLKPDITEPPHKIASVGIIRACQKNSNGTSNLLLQGLCRVEIQGIEREQPYRLIRIRALSSEPGGSADDNEWQRGELSRLLSIKQKLRPGDNRGITAFLKTVKDPEAFSDIAAFSLCDDPAFKQQLLEILDVNRRMHLFADHLRAQIAEIKLQHRLQGPLSDDRVGEN